MGDDTICRDPAPPSGSQGTRREDESWRFPGTHNTTIGCQATRRETRRDYDERQGFTISRDPRHHRPVPKLQERRQEEIMM